MKRLVFLALIAFATANTAEARGPRRPRRRPQQVIVIQQPRQLIVVPQPRPQRRVGPVRKSLRRVF